MRKMKKREIEPRVQAALELVRLTGFEKRRASQLSGGQQQRIALARALVYEPNVLLLDEPLGALDLKLRQEMQIELKHLHNRLGVTIIYVTHDQGEALTMSDRIVVLNFGAIQQVATPDVMYKRPVNRFVADFIGETNFIAGNGDLDGTRYIFGDRGGLRLTGIARDADVDIENATAVVRPESVSRGDGNQRNDQRLRRRDRRDHLPRRARQVHNKARYLHPHLWPNGCLRRTLTLYKQGERVRIGWEADDMLAV